MNKDIIDRLNELGGSGEPFLFVVDYKGDKAYIKKLAEIDPASVSTTSAVIPTPLKAAPVNCLLR